MIRHVTRVFAKCGICGTHGHIDRKCPLADYEKELETGNGNLITAEKLFPNNPELVTRLKRVAERHATRHVVVSELDAQVARLRQAWGIA